MVFPGWKEADDEGQRERVRENDRQDKESPRAYAPLCKHSSNTNTSHKLYSNSNASLLNLQSLLTLLSLHPVAVRERRCGVQLSPSLQDERSDLGHPGLTLNE